MGADKHHSEIQPNKSVCQTVRSADDPPPYEGITRHEVQARPKEDSICFHFRLDPNNTNKEVGPWEVMLTVSNCDVSYLMRNGFYINRGHIRHEDGCVGYQDAMGKTAIDTGWLVYRIYVLENKTGDSQGHWTARMSVYGRDMSMLASFRPENLTVDNIKTVQAKRARNALVFAYDAAKPQDNINAYYDDQELPGLWPRLPRLLKR